MATCMTSKWVATAPQMKLTVTKKSETNTSVELAWSVQYIASSPASTVNSKTYTAKIGDEVVKTAAYNINGKKGAHAVASGTKTVSKSSNATTIEFSITVAWGLTWSGVYCSSKTATGSIAITAKTADGSVFYTVKKGDTLTSIAEQYNTTVAKLVDLNDISDPDYIVVGQKLIVSTAGSGSTSDTTAKTSSDSNKATIKVFGLQSNTDRTVYATWEWSKDNTENYKTMWYYDTGDNDVWFIGSDSTTEHQQSTYTAPSNAKQVKFKVQPQAKSKTTNGTSSKYWTAEWSTEKTYSFSDNPPTTPSEPSIEIEKYTLTAELDDLDVNATDIQFQVVKDNKSIYKTGTAKIITSHASYSCTVAAGGEYKVRCRAYRGNEYSDWSGYSESKSTIPAPPAGITTLKASSETSIIIEWESSLTAENYDIEYATKKEYFEGSDKTQRVSGVEGVHYEKTGLESGEEYFFRVRAVNENGESEWCEPKSIVIGKDPAAPTTWSSSTKIVTGEVLTLYWVHNSEDGSSQTFAELQIYVNGEEQTYTIQNTTDEDEKDKTSYYEIDTSEFAEGVNIQWRVRTAGVTKDYGDWSMLRVVDVHAPATLELSVTDVEGEPLETLTTYPFYIKGLAGPNTQQPIGYHVTVTSNEVYETVDTVGNVKMVNKGEAVYSKYFDITETLLIEMSANNLSLANNASYTVTCVVTMNSGLNAKETVTFNVAWTDEQYVPNAEIGVDLDTYTAHIRPYCEDEHGQNVDDVLLSVYRREFDGTFTELAVDLDGSRETYITDPHPALDYARYRVIARTTTTGAVSYYDVPGYLIGGKAVIIQWEEDWSVFNVVEDAEIAEPVWSGSMLKLPYNIDVSDNHKSDVSLIEYIGRSHPVSYYGTQLGTTSTWSVLIDKTDAETLYNLRRLSRWMGDVYVREPSGSGYWANITVSFSQKHLETTIPVTLDIVRVEGGA